MTLKSKMFLNFRISFKDERKTRKKQLDEGKDRDFNKLQEIGKNVSLLYIL